MNTTAPAKPAPKKSAKKKKKNSVWKTINSVLNRLFIFLFVTGVILVIGGLGVGYIVTREEFPALRDTFVTTMNETRRFRFISRVFLSEEECEEILSRSSLYAKGGTGETATDVSLIHVAAQNPQSDGNSVTDSGEGAADPDAVGTDTTETIDYGYVDEDGDGYILVPVSGRGFNGYMLIVLDPTRCYVAKGGEYQTINMIAERTGAIGGINGGAFRDEKGGGSRGNPEGMTIIDGELVEAGSGERECFMGFDRNGILHVGYYNYSECLEMGIAGGLSHGPALIINGQPQDTSYLINGINPRTAIGQRADGAILMLVIDGRQLFSAGARYDDVTEVMLRFGAVNAINLNGGSSAVMYLNGELVNSPCSASGQSRSMPNAILFR